MIPAFFEGVPRRLIEGFERAGPAAIGFPPAVNGHRLTSSQYGDSLTELGQRGEEPVALYIHLPFCPVRCLYCACHTTVTHDFERIDRYLDALEQELDLVLERLGRGRELEQLHVGGGTPNYLSDSQLVRLMGMVALRFRIPPKTSPLIECNPRRTSASQLELLHSLGFKGLSLGVQDLNPSVQHAMGRINSPELVQDVCNSAREAGFETISLDLIYGLPKQTAASFMRTLEAVANIGPDRVRCYSYSHRPTARPHQYAIESSDLPTPEQKLALLHEAVACFTAAGYQWIGVDCFARPGDELSLAQSAKRLRHNCLGYTGASTQHLIAVGMSALGEVNGAFVQNESEIKPWSAAVHAGNLPVAWGHRLSDGDLRRRRALQHLMCNLELPIKLAEGLEEDYDRLCGCSEHGLVEVDPDCVRITPKGRYFLRSLCTQHELSVAWNSNQWGVPQIA